MVYCYFCASNLKQKSMIKKIQKAVLSVLVSILSLGYSSSVFADGDNGNNNQIQVVGLCSFNPAAMRLWKVTNNGTADQNYSWEITGTAAFGTGVAHPGVNYLVTPTQVGDNAIKISWTVVSGNDDDDDDNDDEGDHDDDDEGDDDNEDIAGPLANANDKVTICHKTGNGNITITISSAALPAHLAHGDKIGACSGGNDDDDNDDDNDDDDNDDGDDDHSQTYTVTSASNPAQCNAPEFWPTPTCGAMTVECFRQGPTRFGGIVQAVRSNTSNALVAEKSDISGPINFFSLGYGGFITLKSNCPVMNGPGADIAVYETTWGSPSQYPTGERARVYASQDGINYVDLGLAVYDATFDLGTLAWARYFRIQDVTSLENSEDAFDVDGIEILNGFTADQAPAPAPVMGAGVMAYAGGTQGKQKSGAAVPAIRSDVNKALGIPQGNDTYNFYTLGFGGDAAFKFGYAVFDGPGADIRVIETSFGSPSCNSYPEKVEASVSYDGTTWFSLGVLCLDGTLDITPAYSGINYIRLKDVSDKTRFPSSGDGFDIDGIVSLPAFGQTPVCAAANGRVAVLSEIADQNNVPDAIETLQIIGNPVADNIAVRFSMVAEKAELTIVNHMGRLISTQALEGKLWELKEMDINAQDLTPGVYFLTVNSGVAKETVKFVKK